MSSGARMSESGPDRIALVEKETRALGLRTAGYSLAQIADELGYANDSGAWKAIKRALRRVPAPEAAEYRTLQDLRLDQMLAGIWDKATTGDTWSIDRAVAIERFRAELFGTLAPKKQEVTGEDGGPIVFTLHIPKNDPGEPVTPPS